MPDDLDDQIRAAMKVLDEETPSGYFEAVPNQILARLEDGSMQHGSGTTDIRDKRDLLTGPPVVAQTEPTPSSVKDRDEDSGLHDIRNLAQSTKQRLSSKRITQNPPMKDEDIIASSSGSWKNIALPQPAKMVSLPELDELPSKQEVIAAQKAAAKARKAKATGDIAAPALKQDVLAPNATANAALASLTAAPVAAAAADAPAVEAAPARQAFTLPSMERKKSKGPLIAFIGLGVAAAAGGVIYMQTQGSEKSAPAQSAMADKQAAPAPAPAPAVKAEPIEQAAAGSAAEPPPAAPAAEEAKTDVAAATAADDDNKPSKSHAKAGAGGSKKAADEAEKTEKKDEPEKVAKIDELKKPEGDGTKKAKDGEGEPSFDALLKEAGVDEKKEVKPKLEKKSLSGDDFKQGMSAVNAKAQGCYKGTLGTATVKLVIAPSGKVSKVTVGGAFAGKPEGACVEAAVKAATFPPWDGGPQTFNYSYMLSD